MMSRSASRRRSRAKSRLNEIARSGDHDRATVRTTSADGPAACGRRRRRELNMRRLCWGTLAVTVVAIEALSASAVGASPSSPTYAFTGGQWWNGSTFVKQTLYTVDGRITAQAPKRVDETIDLKGGFVIPPLAEGHTHWIPQFVDQLSACYLADGVFYAREMR